MTDSYTGSVIFQDQLVGVVDVTGVPTDSSVSATGASPAGGMLARDLNTLLVYARTSAGAWNSILPLTPADHDQMINLTTESHPQYRKFLAIADGSALPAAAAGLKRYLTNRATPVYSDGTSWMTLGDGQERFTYTSGLYYGPAINTSGGAAIPVGVERAAPWFLHRRTAFDQLVAHASTAVASSTFRGAIWADNGSGSPGALVVDGGTDLSANVTETDLVQAITVTLDPGLYWLGGIINSSAAPNMRAVNGQASPFALVLGADSFTNFSFAGRTRSVTGAPTNPFGTATTASAVPAVRLRAA